MRRIILFRFHKSPLVCKNKLEILKKLNPNISIYGLYGGEENKLPIFTEKLKGLVENIYCIKNKSKYYKWKNGDLAIREWFIEVGRKVDFDTVHIVEWDMLILAPISQVYKHVRKGEVGITGLIPLKKVAHEWDWVSEKKSRELWMNLLRYVKKKYKYNKEPFASIAGGLCLPRIFLEKYSKIKVPEECHDEIRVPLFSQIFGLRMRNTKIYRGWTDPKSEEIFTCKKKNISINVIKKELKNKNGKRVFHPYGRIDLSLIK